MTIGAITSAVSTAVYNAFGDGYEIYTDRVTQGLHEPCFLVSCLSGTRNVDLGRRYARTAQFSVQYFPKVEGDSTEINSAFEKLLEAFPLEEIERLKESLFETTPENPEIENTYRIRVDGTFRDCRIVSRVIWSNEALPQCNGSIGRILTE